MSYFIGFIGGIVFVFLWMYFNKPDFKMPFTKKEKEEVVDRKVIIIDPTKK